MRFAEGALKDAAHAAGFRVDLCEVRPVEDMPMDAVYLIATK